MTNLELDKIHKLLLDSLVEGLLVTDNAGKIVHANNKIVEMFGYQLNELKNQKVEILIPDSLKTKHNAYRKTFQLTGRNRPMGKGLNLLAKRKNNSMFPVEISLSPLVQNEQTYVIAIISDISERKELINQLKSEKERAQQYLNMAGNMFVIIDHNSRVMQINPKRVSNFRL